MCSCRAEVFHLSPVIKCCHSKALGPTTSEELLLLLRVALRGRRKTMEWDKWWRMLRQRSFAASFHPLIRLILLGENKHPCQLKKKNDNRVTLFKNYSKCRIWLLAFSTNFCPIKTDLSGNTVWPQASGFPKTRPNGPFLAFLINFCPLKMLARFAPNVEWDFFCDFALLLFEKKNMESNGVERGKLQIY